MGEGQGGGEESLCCPLPLTPSHQGRGDIFGKVIYESKHYLYDDPLDNTI